MVDGGFSFCSRQTPVEAVSLLWDLANRDSGLLGQSLVGASQLL